LDKVEWIGQNVLFPSRIAHGSAAITRLNVHTQQCIVFEFAFKMTIQQIRFFNGNDLVIHTEERNVHNFYKRSIQ
jgi:hypothetical protein